MSTEKHPGAQGLEGEGGQKSRRIAGPICIRSKRLMTTCDGDWCLGGHEHLLLPRVHPADPKNSPTKRGHQKMPPTWATDPWAPRGAFPLRLFGVHMTTARVQGGEQKVPKAHTPRSSIPLALPGALRHPLHLRLPAPCRTAHRGCAQWP